MKTYIHSFLILALSTCSLYGACTPETPELSPIRLLPCTPPKQKPKESLKGKPIPQQPRAFTFSEHHQTASFNTNGDLFTTDDDDARLKNIIQVQKEWGTHFSDKIERTIRADQEYEQLLAQQEKEYEQIQQALQEKKRRELRDYENKYNIRRKETMSLEEIYRQLGPDSDDDRSRKNSSHADSSPLIASTPESSSPESSPKPQATSSIMATLERFNERVKNQSRRVSLYNVQDIQYENNAQEGDNAYAAMPENPYYPNKKQQEREQLLDFSVVDVPYKQLPEDEAFFQQQTQSAASCCCVQQ